LVSFSFYKLAKKRWAKLEHDIDRNLDLLSSSVSRNPNKAITLAIIAILILGLSLWFWIPYSDKGQESIPGSDLYPGEIIALQCSPTASSYISDGRPFSFEAQGEACCSTIVLGKQTVPSIGPGTSLPYADAPFGNINLTLSFVNSNGIEVASCNTTLNIFATDKASFAPCEPSRSSSLVASSGDYTVVEAQYNSRPIPSFVSAIPIRLVGSLHVLSLFETQERETQDGTNLTTFVATLFFVPIAVLEVRRFITEP
jgi:hypothetical protein